MRWTLVCVVVLLGCASSSKSSTSTNNATSSAPLAPGCKRMRDTFVYRCSGMPPDPGEPNSTPTTVCDECLSDADCTAKPGGSCQERGDSMCSGPRRAVCLYPDPACGGAICKERVIEPPP